MNNSLLKQILIALSIVLFASCESGFNEIGTEIVGDDDFLFEKDTTYSVIAFNQYMVVNGSGVQTNNLPINALGVLVNPTFGTTTSNFVTQLELKDINPTIDLDLNQVIDSVILTVPYFSTQTGVDSDGETKLYELDSIYGPADSKLDLRVYESKYYLRDINPSTQEAQEYYSNQNNVFEDYKGELLNTNIDASQNTQFVFSNKVYKEKTTNKEGEETVTSFPPAMRLYLDKAFFQQKFFSEDANGNLDNNNVFKNYFRGLFFDVSHSLAEKKQQALINFKGGKITIYYKQDLSDIDHTEANRVSKTLILNLKGTTVNLFDNIYNTGAPAPDPNNGNETLILKGGAGSMNVIELFGPDTDGNGVADELEQLRANDWLINDASLTFYIDQTKMEGASGEKLEPNRIYLYDLNNKKPILDYTVDVTVRAANKYNKFIYGGIIEKSAGTDSRGVKYKIKITNHLRKLIQNDTVTNVRLGLVVTESINIIENYSLETPVFSDQIKKIPAASIMNPLGTILFGNNIPEGSPNYDKRLKLEIFYTKPD